MLKVAAATVASKNFLEKIGQISVVANEAASVDELDEFLLLVN